MKVTFKKAIRTQKSITVVQRISEDVPGTVLREGIKFQFGDTPNTIELITDVTWLVASGEAIAWVNGLDSFPSDLEKNVAAYEGHGWTVESMQERPG